MYAKAIALLSLVAASPVLAFTNGSIVPPYICNPKPDGLPKSFGQLLLFTREQVKTVAFSQNQGQNIQAPPLQQQNGLQIGNTAYILASFHDSPNNINSQSQQITVNPTTGNSVAAGKANKLTLTAGGGNNVQLKGVLAYARDASGNPQGTFTDAGNIFVKFPGCGVNAQGQINGVIQSTGVSATNTYTQLSYQAPACIPGGKVTIAGLSVTAKGFGTWSYSFPVTGSTCTGAATTSNNSTGTGNTAGNGGTTTQAGNGGAANQGGKTGNTGTSTGTSTSTSTGTSNGTSTGGATGQGGKKSTTGSGNGTGSNGRKCNNPNGNQGGNNKRALEFEA